jgi:ATP-dependent Clp protease ATP-binding subunit ClpC
MFEPFTDAAHQVIFWAFHLALEAGSVCIETEHLLTGVLATDPALAQRYPALAGFAPQSSVEAARPPILEPVPRRDLPMSDEAKPALARAAEQSERLGHRQIGTEHLLLGLLLEDDSQVARALREAGFDPSRVREELAASR